MRCRIGLLWLVLQLVLGQQFALAHMIGHAGELAHDVTTASIAHAVDGDEEHTPAHALSHVCTGCVSGVGLDSVLAQSVSMVVAAGESFFRVATAVSPAPTLAFYPPFRGRAPPHFQS